MSAEAIVATLEAMKNTLVTMQAQMEMGAAGGGGGREGRFEEGSGKKDILFGKGFEVMAKFGGGEAEWHEWSGDFRTMVQTKSEMAGDAMNYVKNICKVEKEVLGWVDVMRGIKDLAEHVDEQETVLVKYKDLGKVSKELYRWLGLATEGEAKLIVISEEEEGDGIKVWGLLHA